jgi:hypothetical protein
MANKRTSIGVVPVSKLEKNKIWQTYIKASQAFSKAKQDSGAAKDAVRQYLKSKLPQLGDKEIDFLMINGTELNIYEVSKTEGKSRRRNVIELEFS